MRWARDDDRSCRAQAWNVWSGCKQPEASVVVEHVRREEGGSRSGSGRRRGIGKSAAAADLSRGGAAVMLEQGQGRARQGRTGQGRAGQASQRMDEATGWLLGVQCVRMPRRQEGALLKPPYSLFPLLRCTALHCTFVDPPSLPPRSHNPCRAHVVQLAHHVRDPSCRECAET